MALLRIDEPAVEPASLDEAKQHLRLDTGDDDTLVAGLITAARSHVEQLLARALITQTWIEVRDDWPDSGRAVRLSVAPVQAVLEIRVVDGAGVSDIVPAADYFADLVSEPARLCPASAGQWPRPGRVLNGIEIEFTAGYGDLTGDVPHPLRQAVLLLVAHWYEQREPVTIGAAAAEVPQTVAGLIAPYRMRRIT